MTSVSLDLPPAAASALAAALDQVAAALRSAGSSLVPTVPTVAPARPAAAVSAPPLRLRGKLAPLLRSGALVADDRLTFTQPRAGRVAYATVEVDGAIVVDGISRRFYALSTAAGAVTGGAIDGWTLWRRVRGDVLLDDLR